MSEWFELGGQTHRSEHSDVESERVEFVVIQGVGLGWKVMPRRLEVGGR